MHAGSSNKHIQKRWPYFRDLALILKHSFEIVWVGGDDDIDLNANLVKSVGINATNDFDILRKSFAFLFPFILKSIINSIH